MATSMDRFTMSQLPNLRWADARRRVRAFLGGVPVADAADARIVWEPHRVVASYAVPIAALASPPSGPRAVAPAEQHAPVLTPDDDFRIHTTPGTSVEIAGRAGAGFIPDDPDLRDWVLLDWRAFDEWREEDQTVLSHPHDPFQRIDSLRSSREVEVRAHGTQLARSTRSVLLLETHLPPRHYLRRQDVRMELLVPSDTTSECAYKGAATYFSARVGRELVPDVAWTYVDPLHDGLPVRGLICFYDERVEVSVDGVPTRPR